MINVNPSSKTPTPPPPIPSCFSKTLCERVSRALIHSQRRTAEEKKSLLPFLAQFREAIKEDTGAQELSLLTANGTIINGLHFSGTQKKALIYLHGNGCYYETSTTKPRRWREDLKQTIDGVDAYPHLVVCNTGGTGLSQGNTHPDTTARELLAQFEYLVYQHGIDPSDIVIGGHSMGGYLSAFGAQLIQQQFPDSQINFISDRSFDTIYSRVEEGSLLSQTSMCFNIYMTNWGQDVAAALETLKGRVCIVYHLNDPVIPYEHSTHTLLTNTDRSRDYSCLSMRDDSDSSAHNREFTDDEEKRIVVEMKRMLRIPLTPEEEILSLEILNRSW